MTALQIGSVTAWIAVLILFVQPVWRIVRRRARYLDALWCVMLLGVVNRLVFASGISLAVAHLSAILLCGLLFVVVRSYQQADR